MKNILLTLLIICGMAALLVMACGEGEPEEQSEITGDTAGEIEEEGESAHRGFELEEDSNYAHQNHPLRLGIVCPAGHGLADRRLRGSPRTNCG